MRKLAFFVEGAAEMLFVEGLISEVANKNDVIVDKKKIRGGGKSGKHPKRFQELAGAKQVTDERFYVLIYDCGGDQLVAQRIREEHANLTVAGYEKIIGIRDVRPSFQRHEIQALQQGMESAIDKSLAPVVFILTEMEVEAWFLAEYSHFSKIHPELNAELINDSLGFDPRTFRSGERDHPALDLEQAYSLKGVVYDKYSVEKTVDVLDFAIVYTELSVAVPELAVLSSNIDRFLTKVDAV